MTQIYCFHCLTSAMRRLNLGYTRLLLFSFFLCKSTKAVFINKFQTLSGESGQEIVWSSRCQIPYHCWKYSICFWFFYVAQCLGRGCRRQGLKEFSRKSWALFKHSFNYACFAFSHAAHLKNCLSEHNLRRVQLI